MKFWPERQPLPSEADLRASFAPAVGSLSLENLVAQDQPAVPSRLNDYGLVPIVGNAERNRFFYESAGFSWHIEHPDADHIQMGYMNGVTEDGTQFTSKPYVDGEFALGLTYCPPRLTPAETRLVALASANIPKAGTLRAVQLQAAWTRQEPRKKDTGLYGGFVWAKALARGLVQVARETGFRDVEILGYEARNKLWWLDEARKEHWKQLYDGTAHDLGFRRRRGGRWTLKLR